MKDNNKLIFNDTEEIRGFASNEFNWILDKESCIACCWGRTAKENPEFDPIGPEEITWKITNFDLNKYINYFNFLTNIHLKESDDKIIPLRDATYEESMKNIDKLICMSTFSNMLFNLDYEYLKEIFSNFVKFINYIKKFNVAPKFIISYNDNCNLIEYSELIKEITDSIIIEIKEEFFTYTTLLKHIDTLKENKFNINLQINVNNDNYGQVHNLIDEISNEVPIILNFDCKPYVSVEKYIKFQQYIKDKELTNVFMTQCAKHFFNKSVVGSILLQIECPAARFGLYIENNKLFPCKYTTSESIEIENCKTIHDFWMNPFFSKIRNNLILNRVCQK